MPQVGLQTIATFRGNILSLAQRSSSAFSSYCTEEFTRESISFSELAGFDGAASILDSKRIRGICHRLELTKGLTRKAKVLLCKQVRTLERIMHDHNIWLADGVKASHDLFTNSGRLRWKDSQWRSKAKVDKNAFGAGYLDCEKYVTKTFTPAKKKTTMLRLAVPIRLLETSDFASKFLSLREKSGLPDIGVLDAQEIFVPALPTVNRRGKFTDKPLSTSYAGKWTRELLAQDILHFYSRDVLAQTCDPASSVVQQEEDWEDLISFGVSSRMKIGLGFGNS